MPARIPHSRPSFGEHFSQAAESVIASGHTASGNQAKHLEYEILQHINHDSAVAVDSGTSALMLAIRALATQRPIRRVGIPAYACASLLWAVRAAGCQPVYMDCQQDLRLDADQAWDIASSLDAVILVHPFGMIEPLIAEAWPCPVIEDIAQAAGAIFKGQAVGSLGDIAIASFYATKPWGGAYGGMVMSSSDICSQVRSMSNPDICDSTQHYIGHHQLSDIHACLASCRLQCYEDDMKQRQQCMQWLDQQLPEHYVQSISQRHSGNAFRYIIRSESCAESLIKQLQKQGIGASHPVQQSLNLTEKDIGKGAYKAWKDCISLPLLANLTAEEYTQYEQGLHTCFAY